MDVSQAAAVTEIPWGWIIPANTILIFLTGAATWLYTRGGKEAVLAAQVAAAEASLVTANNRAEKAENAQSDLMNSLHAHMLSDAASFARLEAIAGEATRSGSASEIRLTSAIDKLVGRIDNMAEQFNSFVREFAHQVPKPQ